MPRLAIDYTKTLIYKIVHQDDYENANVYVGHTTDFRVRKSTHKSHCNNPNNKGYNDKKYQYIRDNGDWDAFKMVEIEKYPCQDEREASAREEYWRDKFKANLNTIRCFITKEQRLEQKKQYYEDNADKILEYQKQYYEENANKLKEQMRQYYEDNIDKLKEQMRQYRQDNADKIKEQRRQYLKNNADKIKEQMKQYNEENADKIKEQKREKVVCEYCGMSSRKADLKKHQRSAKCLKAKEALQ